MTVSTLHLHSQCVRSKSLAAGGALLAAFLTMTLVACGPSKPAAPPPPKVVVAEVIQQDVPITREWVGTLQGSTNAEIRPKVDGFVLKQLYTEGMPVKQGQPLFQLDSRVFKAALDQAKGNLDRAEAALSLANITVDRYTPLVKENAVSQQELDTALSQQRQAKGNLETAKAQLDQAQLNLNWCTVTSLISGIAGMAQIQVGSLVNPLSVLTTVSTVDPIYVDFGISEQQYMNYTEAMKGRPMGETPPLSIILSSGQTYPHPGKVIILNRQVDVKTGTITARGEFPNPENLLRPGQYAKVQMVAQMRKGALLVPQEAVRELQGDNQVAVVGADNAVEMRSVNTGERVGRLWVVEKGLQPGEKVIVAGLQMVKSGTKVEIVTPPPAGSAPADKAPAASEGR